MLVPPTASLYSPSSSSISDIVGRAAAPYFDAMQGAVRKLFHRDPPAIYSQLPAADEALNPIVVPRKPLTGTHVAATALIATTCAVGCSTGSDLGDTITKAVLNNLAGGLAIFLYNMELMSDGLTASVGDQMRTVLKKLAGNRVTAAASGAVTTGIIQSSSATSVLAVRFVEAKILDRQQAYGIIAGANIGTTGTIWLVYSGLAQYSLSIAGIAGLTYFFLRNSTKERLKQASKGLFGLGVLLYSMKIMSEGFKQPAIKEGLKGFFSNFSEPAWYTTLACMVTGGAATAIVQSSSATVAIIAGLAGSGIIPYETAVALCIGANMGTTATAWIATPGTGTDAKRVAIAHTLFNIAGALAVLPWCSTFAELSLDMARQFGLTDAKKQIAMAHTFFNIGAAAIFLGGMKYVEKLVMRIKPDSADESLGYGQGRLSKALLDEPEFALKASKDVIKEANALAEAALEELLKVLASNKLDGAAEQTIRETERSLNDYRANLMDYFKRLGQRAMEKDHSQDLHAQRRMAVQFEKIGDHALNLMLTFKDRTPEDLPEATRTFLIHVNQEIEEHFLLANQLLVDAKTKQASVFFAENDRLKSIIDEHRAEILQEASPETQFFYHDVLGIYREIIGNIKNIADAVTGKK